MYRDARDVAAYAAMDRLTTWYTYPHVWHLDQHGRTRRVRAGLGIDLLCEGGEWGAVDDDSFALDVLPQFRSAPQLPRSF